MKLYAISDLHIEHQLNSEALKALPAFPEDWLIIAGDICSSLELVTPTYTRYGMLNVALRQVLICCISEAERRPMTRRISDL